MPADELEELVDEFGEDGLVALLALGGGQFHYEDEDSGRGRVFVALTPSRRLAVYRQVMIITPRRNGRRRQQRRLRGPRRARAPTRPRPVDLDRLEAAA